jgi:hypothetical protein
MEMAEIHNKWQGGGILTDMECRNLYRWLCDVADYMGDMRQGWIAIHLHSEKEQMARMLEARGIKTP